MSRTPPGTHLGEPSSYSSATSTASGGRASARRRRARSRPRRIRVLAPIALVVGAALAGGALVKHGLGLGAAAGATSSAASVVTSAAPSAATSAAPTTTVVQEPVLALPGDYPKTGPGTFAYAPTQGPILGTAGNLRRFHVAIETGVPEDPAAFAATIDETLGDPRSWIAGGTFRLQRVPQNAAAQFTIYLATPGTADRMCGAGGLDIRMNGVPYTSCRLSGRVIINLARWRESVPDYVNGKIPLDTYRRYVINHETGHEFGHGHELCPGSGKPAPVMQQQTLTLAGCTANAWPYLDGRRYQGPAGNWG